MRDPLYLLAALLGILLGTAWAAEPSEPPTVLELVWTDECGWWEVGCR